jgi:hypothetical protein
VPTTPTTTTETTATTATTTTRSPRAPKADQACLDAVDLARAAAVETAGVIGVGEHVGAVPEGDRVLTHVFASTHPGYAGWHWSVTVARASRAKVVTVDEVVLLPGDGSLLAPRWVPWAERVGPGDVSAGLLMASPADDARLEPGYTGGEHAADADPAEEELARVVVAELGLGRERVLSRTGRDEAAQRWLLGPPGPDNNLTRQAPGVCETCGFFTRLTGGLGVLFGACTNSYSVSDGQVVSVDHGCGAHSSVVEEEHVEELPALLWETIDWDQSDALFD